MLLAHKVDAERAQNLLSSVGIADRQRARPHQLSGGELARAGLAVALAAAPPIVLADEPTGEVDAITERSILDVMSAHCRAGAAILVATDSQALAAEADRIIHLQDGRLSMAEILVEGAKVTRRFQQGDVDVYGYAASFMIDAGDRIALLGVRVAESRLCCTLCSSRRANERTVDLACSRPTWRAMAQTHWYRFKREPDPNIECRRNFELPLRLAGDIPSPRSEAMKALEAVGLVSIADTLPDELSGGQAERVALARAIAPKPRLILIRADRPAGSSNGSADHRCAAEIG